MYTEIANLYHLIYEDWDAAIEQQGHAFDQLFQRLLGTPPPLKVLDVSCGIGTQAIGLAAHSHHVTASDLSEAAVQRARREAEKRGLSIRFSVADMRDCAVHGGGFDVVLSADNSLPHLAGKSQVAKALTSFYESLRPGGVAIVGMRDYTLPGERGDSPQLLPYGFRQDGQDRYLVFQTRDWAGDEYDVAMYFVRESRDGRPAHVTSGVSRYYVIEVDRVIDLFKAAGFEDARRMDDVIYQPVVVGRRPAR